MSDNEQTARRLVKAMSDANISQRELAERSGVKESSISHYATGRHAPSNISAAKMAEVLGVDPLYLMGFDVKDGYVIKQINDSVYINQKITPEIHALTRNLKGLRAKNDLKAAHVMTNAVQKEIDEASTKSGYDYTMFPRVSNSPEEGYLVDKYREMPEEKRKKLLAYMMGLCKGADLDET